MKRLALLCLLLLIALLITIQLINKDHSPISSILPSEADSTPAFIAETSLMESTLIEHAETKKELVRAHPPEHDSTTFPFNPEQGIPITSFIVIGNDALAFGDILVAEVEDILDLERRGFIPHLPQPRTWPDGIVPYVIDPEVEQYHLIREVMDVFESVAVIQFMPHIDEENYVTFYAGEEHCFAHLGMIGGPQKVVLSPSCGAYEIAHELMHVLGFIHEQNRIDRDEFVTVHWEHIDDGFHEQFKKIPSQFVLRRDSELFNFSFETIMLYTPNLFAMDPARPTMSRRDRRAWPILKEEMLGKRDRERLRAIYGE
jgi:hypothetical protein